MLGKGRHAAHDAGAAQGVHEFPHASQSELQRNLVDSHLGVYCPVPVSRLRA
jgi:hypothetical protein